MEFDVAILFMMIPPSHYEFIWNYPCAFICENVVRLLIGEIGFWYLGQVLCGPFYFPVNCSVFSMWLADYSNLCNRVLCKFFAHGACLKGEHCEFSHDWKDPPNNVGDINSSLLEIPLVIELHFSDHFLLLVLS